MRNTTILTPGAAIADAARLPAPAKTGRRTRDIAHVRKRKRDRRISAGEVIGIGSPL